MLSLYRIATGEDWTDIMYINMYGCKRYGYSEEGTVPREEDCEHTQSKSPQNRCAAPLPPFYPAHLPLSHTRPPPQAWRSAPPFSS